jgi:hypothetical protein
MDAFFAGLLGAFRKFGPIPLTALSLVGAILLFTSAETLKQIGVDTIVATYRSWIGLAWLVASGLLLSHFVWWVRGIVGQNLKLRQRQRIRIRSLQELTPGEKHFLSPYIFENLNSQAVTLGNGVVGGLVAKGIVFRAADFAEFGEFPYNLQPWARTYLSANPDLLAGAHLEPCTYSDQLRSSRRQIW